MYKTVHFQHFFSCHLRIICFPTTNSFISCILFNSRITIQILTLIMMFREKNLFLRFISFFKSNPLEIWFTHHMWHIMYAYGWNLHHCIRVILTVQGRCSIGQGKYSNYTRLSFVKDFNQFWTIFFLSCHLRIAHS